MKNETLLVDMLVNGCKKLENAGADFIVIACNSAQYYLPEMRAAIKLPIISTAGEVSKKIKTKGCKKFLLLATNFTVDKKVYTKTYSGLVVPDKLQQQRVNSAIMRILSGEFISPKESLTKAINEAKGKGADAVILGCTELPLVIKQEDFDIPLLDSTQITAEAAVRFCKEV